MQECLSGLPFPSPGDLPAQGLDPGLPNYRQALYCLSYQGSPSTCERDLIWNWGLCRYSQFKMMSYGIRMGPNPVTGILAQWGRFRHTERRECRVKAQTNKVRQPSDKGAM